MKNIDLICESVCFEACHLIFDDLLIYIFSTEYIGVTVVVCSSPFLKITWLGQGSALPPFSQAAPRGYRKKFSANYRMEPEKFGMLSWWSQWMVSDCTCWEYPNPIPVFNTPYVWPGKPRRDGVLDVYGLDWWHWKHQGALFPDDARHYRVDVLEVPFSERGDPFYIYHMYVSIAEEPFVWLLGPCWTLFFVIAGCSWLFLFWNLTNLRADISLFPTSKLQESDDQASADQHSAIWVNGDKFELSPEAMKSGQRVDPEIGLEMAFFILTCSGCNQDSWVDCTCCRGRCYQFVALIGKVCIFSINPHLVAALNSFASMARPFAMLKLCRRPARI